ncbi:MAG TPA: LCP family protein, partial [Candidatus Xenobia bacterium]
MLEAPTLDVPSHPPAPLPPPTPRRTWRRAVVVLFTSLALTAVAMSAAWYYFARSLPGPTGGVWQFMHPPGDHFFGDRDSRNILVLGIDYDYTDSDQPFSRSARSDTMFLLNVTRDGRHVGMLSMPRDLFVTFPDGHQDKINTAYSVGGIPLVRRMLEHFLKVPVDYAVVVRINAATKVIDRLGGLPIRVEKAMDYDDNWGHLHIHLQPGVQTLNGQQAVGYARFRHDEE